jgi:hypothetical protein
MGRSGILLDSMEEEEEEQEQDEEDERLVFFSKR